MVSFHLNPVASEVGKAIEKFHYLPVTSKVSGSRVSIFGKVKALIRNKFVTMRRPSSQYQKSETTVSELLQIVSLLLAPKEVTEQEELVRKKAKKVKPGRDCDGCNNSWQLGLPKGSKCISSMFLSGKWTFLRSPLAIRAPGPCNH
jgi:hypothetical protein